MRRRSLPLPLLAAVGVAVVAPASASAGTMTVNRPCYTHFPATAAALKTQPILIAITGGTPGGSFQVRAGSATADGGSGSATGTFDGAGNGRAVLEDVFPPGGGIGPLSGTGLKLATTDFATGAVIATASTKITNAAIQVADLPRNPYRERVVRVSGLTPLLGGGTLYGSYVKGSTGKSTKVIKRVKLGRPNACGYLRVRRVLPPRRGVARYTLFVHVGSKLVKTGSLFYSFRVFRT